MMEHRFNIINFMQQPMQYNQEIDITVEVLQDINISFSLLLKYREQTNTVGVQIDILYTHQEKRILTYSILLTLHDDLWQDFLKTGPKKEQICEYALPWFRYTFDFMRGALAVHAINTPVKQLFLPMIDLDSIKPFIKLEKL